MWSQCGLHVRVPQQFLHGANIDAAFTQMRGKGMAQRVWRGGLVNACQAQGVAHVALNRLFIGVTASHCTAVRIAANCGGRKHKLPSPFLPRRRKFARRRQRQFDRIEAAGQILRMQRLDPLHLFVQRQAEGDG